MRTNTILAVLFGLATLTFLGLGIYYLVRFSIGLFEPVSPEVAAITAAAAITLLLGALIIAGGLREIGRREERGQQRTAQAAVYERFLRLRTDTHRDGSLVRGDRRFSPEDPLALDQQMLLHANAEVLKAYLRLRRAEKADTATDSNVQQEVVRLVRAMRRDLGQRSPDVGATELAELMRMPSREHA